MELERRIALWSLSDAGMDILRREDWADSTQQELLNMLVEYLAAWDEAAWFDDDAVFALALQLNASVPLSVMRFLVKKISGDLKESRAARVFLSALQGIDLDAGRELAPTAHEWRALVGELKQGFVRESHSQLATLFRRQQSATARSGDYGALIRQYIQAARALLQPAQPSATRLAAYWADKLMREAALWEPQSVPLLVTWAKARMLRGDEEAARQLLWSGIHFLPQQESPWAELVRLLTRHPEQRGEAVAVGRSAVERLSKNNFVFTAYVQALSASGAARRAEAKSLLVSQLRRVDEASMSATIWSSILTTMLSSEDFELAIGEERPILRLLDRKVICMKIISSLGKQGRGDLAELALRYGAMKFPEEAWFSKNLSPERDAEDASEEDVAGQDLAEAPGKGAVHQDSNRAQDLLPEEVGPLEPIPDEYVMLGGLRRARFLLEETTGSLHKEGLELLRSIYAVHPESAYAQMLAVRHKAISDVSAELPTFAAAFEAALSQHDAQALETLSVRFPRLEALIWVARALLGEPLAIEMVRRWLSDDRQERQVNLRHAKARLRVVWRAVEARGPDELVSGRSRDAVLRIVRDAAEVSLHLAA